jgi:hypothetical protein
LAKKLPALQMAPISKAALKVSALRVDTTLVVPTPTEPMAVSPQIAGQGPVHAEIHAEVGGPEARAGGRRIAVGHAAEDVDDVIVHAGLAKADVVQTIKGPCHARVAIITGLFAKGGEDARENGSLNILGDGCGDQGVSCGGRMHAVPEGVSGLYGRTGSAVKTPVTSTVMTFGFGAPAAAAPTQPRRAELKVELLKPARAAAGPAANCGTPLTFGSFRTTIRRAPAAAKLVLVALLTGPTGKKPGIGASATFGPDPSAVQAGHVPLVCAARCHGTPLHAARYPRFRPPHPRLPLAHSAPVQYRR